MEPTRRAPVHRGVRCCPSSCLSPADRPFSDVFHYPRLQWKTDHRDLPLLRVPHERPSCRTAEQRDELAPCHAKLPGGGRRLPNDGVMRHSKIGGQMQRWVKSRLRALLRLSETTNAMTPLA